MKKTELLKFIEDEVNQIVKSEKSKPATKKTEPAKPKELKEEDFDEVMFKRVNESKNIRKIISKIMKENYDFVGEEEKNNLTKLNKSKGQYKIYNNSFSEVCSEAIDFAKEKGYEVDEDDWFNKVSVGPKKPSEGDTNRYSIELKKDGKSQKKMLHFQVYGMKSGKYELNAYIN